MIITLLDGSTVDTNNVSFDESTYKFTYGDNDITKLIKFTDKENNWPNFDPQTALMFSYNAGQVSPDVKDTFKFDTGAAADSQPGTSTWGNFFDQITTDPLQAPLQSADNHLTTLASNTVKSVLTSWTGLIVLGLFGVWAYVKLFKK